MGGGSTDALALARKQTKEKKHDVTTRLPASGANATDVPPHPQLSCALITPQLAADAELEPVQVHLDAAGQSSELRRSQLGGVFAP